MSVLRDTNREKQMTVSLNQVQQLADMLSTLDQVRLIEHLSRQIAPAIAKHPVAPAASRGEDAWARLEQLRTELAALPAERLASEQLEADRAERQANIEGGERVHR